jgi:branched-chain amino acid transport system ATP-binding protein
MSAADDSVPLVLVEDVHTYYGKSHILHGVTLKVGAGEVVGLLGRNGVGKSTTLKTIMGLVRPSHGSVLLDGNAITGLAPHKLARLGIGYVPEDRRIFRLLTVMENLRTGLDRNGVTEDKRRALLDKVFTYFPVLAERRNQAGGTLSGGEQQMLAIARALATNPSVLLLDEPVEGLAPLVIQELVAAIARMRAGGDLAILMVEQKFEIALANSDRCLVMDHGEIVHHCASKELLHDQATLDRLIGVAE